MRSRSSKIEECHECGAQPEYPDHSAQILRINRIIGQLEGVKRMIEQKRYCPEILMQTKAVTSALRSLDAAILERHLASCVKSAFLSKDPKESSKKIEELLDIFKQCP